MIVFEPIAKTQLNSTYEVINSSQTMIRVHVAVLAYIVFKARLCVYTSGVGSIYKCFGTLTRDLGLEYLEYKIREKV